MKSLILLILLVCSLPCAEDDSTKVYRLNDVVITGTKTPISIEKLSVSVTIVDSVELSQSNGISLADVLKNSTGISLRGYGGNGSLQSVSLRGMGSDYALILIDGQRYTTFQLSTVDLGIFSLNEVERIEIAGGGNSSLYGADAVGGVINIITKKPNGNIFAAISHYFGSYGLNGYQITAGGGSNLFSYRGSMKLLRASNSYEFIFDDGLTRQTLQRNGSDYSLKNYSLAARSLLSERIVMNISVRYADADRGQPAAVTNTIQNNLARISDKDLFIDLSTEFQNSESFGISLPISFHNNRQQYNDQNVIIGGKALSSNYDNNSINLSPFVRYIFSSNHQLAAGTDVAIASIVSNELIPSRREQRSGFFSSQHRFLIPFEIIIFPSIRYDSFSDIQGGTSAKIGVNVPISEFPSIRLRGSYGNNYRVPTFNDLYWFEGGNPNLRPERSRNIDAGVIGILQYKTIDASIDANIFSIEANDKIVWQPAGNTIWTPKNIQSVLSTGFELGIKLNLFNDLFKINYHHNFYHTVKTSAEFPNDDTQNKILPFVPQETSTLNVGSSIYGISMNVLYSFTGFRYETADNNAKYILPTFETIDVNVTYTFNHSPISFRLKGEVNNLLNREYQFIRGYPTPLRNYMLTTEFSI